MGTWHRWRARDGHQAGRVNEARKPISAISMGEKNVQAVIPAAANCIYTSCYCEENVWKLCELIKDNCSESELSKCFGVFISNESKKIPLWHQKAGQSAEKLVVWDYHVIFLYQSNLGAIVYDLDTELGFPCPLKKYAAACIGDEATLKEEYKRMFRVIPAKEFLTTFASDRSHMLTEEGDWKADPPTYPPIVCQGSTNNIEEFISMDKSINHGHVYDLKHFLDRFQVHL